MKKLALFVLICASSQAGVVRLVTPPVVQKAGHAALKVTKKPRHWIWKAIW